MACARCTGEPGADGVPCGSDGGRSEEWKQLDALFMEYDRANPEHVHILDSIYALRDAMKRDGRAFTPEARALIQEQERIHRELNVQ